MVVGAPLAHVLGPVKETPRLHRLKKETLELAGRVTVMEKAVMERDPTALLIQKSFD
jgi:hypothetical protein